MKYYIEKKQYFTSRGIGITPYFVVYHTKDFLGLFPYKKYAEETYSAMGNCYSSAINFKTEELAESFIKDVLCAGIKTETTQRTIIKEITCS
jgi:hypothetical protein